MKKVVLMRKLNEKICFKKLVAGLILTILMNNIALGAVPATFVYEGRLLNSSQEAITTAHTLRFSFWKSADWSSSDTSIDGTINTGATNYGGWFEEQTITPNTNGTFSVDLGSETSLPDIDFTNHKYLQIEVKTQGSADTSYQLLDPTGDAGADSSDRNTIGSIPYSSVSNQSSSTDEETFIFDADDTGGNLVLQFGTTLNERLFWDSTGTIFTFTDDLNVMGNLDIDGTITAGTSDIVITQADGKIDGEQIADNSIDEDSLDFGTGTGQIGGTDIPLTDEFAHSDSSNVQDVMDDIDQKITDVINGDTAILGTTAQTFILDKDDTGGDLTLQFGNSLGEKLYWDSVNTKFLLSDDVNITGNLDVDGTITTGSADTAITQADGKIDGEQIADDTIDDDSLDFGMGTDQIGADDIIMTNEFDNSANTNVQDVVDDLDQAISDIHSGSSSTSGTTSNTYILDSDDTGGNVILQFGTTLNETMYWDSALGIFVIDDDVKVNGILDVQNTIHAGSGHVQITNPDGTLDGEQISDDSIDEDSLDWGTGTGQISAEDIPFLNTNNYFTSAQLQALADEIGLETYDRWSTGLLSGGAITDAGGNEINIASGEGYINYNTIKNIKISWNAINNVAMSYNGDNYLYINESGQPFISQLPPTNGAKIYLGYIYTALENTDIGMISSVPLYVGDHGRRLNQWILDVMGPLVESGNIVAEDDTDLKLIVTSGTIYNSLSTINTTEKTNFTKWYKSADDSWAQDIYSPNYVNTTQINTITNNASTNLSGTSTFTNGSATVAGAGTSFSSEVTAGDYIYLSTDTFMYKAKVQSVDNDTQITLTANYTGTGGAGTGVVDKALVDMTTGYWKKDLVLRTMDDNIHYLYGQEEFATETLAQEGAIPTIPSAIQNSGSAFLATIVSQKGDTSINNRLYDVRPNFERIFGYGTSGTTGSAADHGALQGLGDDDHIQYFNVDGSDTMTGDIQLGGNAILGATIDGDENTIQDIDWTSIKTRNKSFHLYPGYNNLAMEEDGSNNIATLVLGHDSVRKNNYYKLSSAENSLQDLTLIVMTPLPNDFVGWQSTPIEIEVKSTTINETDNQLDVFVEDSNGADVSLNGGSNLHSAVADTWVTKNITFTGLPTWTAGSFIKIKINLQAKDSKNINIGEIKLNYTGK